MDSLFQFAVLLDPTDEEREAGAKSQLIVPPGEWIVAKSEAEVGLHAARHSAMAEHMDHADRLRIVIRPF
jgi:hypothetical protein